MLDNSMSMRGLPIAELNAGIDIFRRELNEDNLAAKRVEVAIMTFGPVDLVSDFETAVFFLPPNLRARGATPMGEAIITGIDLVEERKRRLPRMKELRLQRLQAEVDMELVGGQR
jgi:uncharacterized protein YegL